MELRDIFTFKNLYKAYLKCRSGKQNKIEVLEYESNIVENLQNVVNNFKKGIWPEIEYYQFVITKPKQRIIDATSFENRIIQACFCENYLYDLLNPYFVEQSSACQKDKGVLHAINNVENYMIEHAKNNGMNFWVLKCDISKFFQSIDKEVLKSQLKIFKEDECIKFLHYIIDSFKGKGLPLGNRTSQLLALFYLKDVDFLITKKYKINEYSRYADDLVIFYYDKQILINLLNNINIIIDKELKMELNNKTNIFPISNSLSFLGWKYFYGTNNRVIKTIRKERKPQARKKYRELVHTKNINGLQSFMSNLSYGKTYNFRKSLKA